ncbi:MAG: dihydrolipoyl dehydrogenase family protein, partial [Acidimicrobiia bacterium]
MSATASHQLVVVGAGAAGLAVAFCAATAGVDTAIIEGGRIGGECTWTGCIPSKTLIDAARRVYQAKNSSQLGISTGDIDVDFPALMKHIHSVSDAIAEEEGQKRLEAAGVHVHRSFATFRDPHTLVLADGTAVAGKRIVLATGGRPRVPEPLRGVAHLTNENLWDLEELPAHLAVVGGGAIGCELAQAFRRLGSEVTIINDVEHLIPGAHPDAAAVITQQLVNEGVTIHRGRTAVSATDGDHSIRIALDDGAVVTASHLLVATGRDMSIQDLDPLAAGIDIDEDGRPIIDTRLRTSQSHISVCGDASGAGFTHVASAQAADVLVNLMSPIAVSVDTGVPRWAIFTDPEIAQVGRTAPEASNHGVRLHTTRIPLTRVDRAMTGSATNGFIETAHSRTGKLHGVTIVSPNAAELANQWVRPVSKNRRLATMAFDETIYPTLGSSNAVLAFEWAEDRLRTGAIGKVVRT